MINNIFRNITIFNTLVISAFLIATLLPASLSAQEIALSAMVDKNDITLDDYVLLRLSVKGTRDEPQLPEVPEFRIQPRGSSSQVRIVNGQMSSTVEYNYLLYPKKTGSFTIGPFYLKGRGRRIESNTIRISVQKAEAADTASKDVFVVAEVDNDRPYVYEQIIYTFKFCRAVKVASASLTEAPFFDGFIKQKLGKENEYQKVINGRQFIVTEIKHALFPTKTGVLEITPSTLQCSLVVQKRRRSRSSFNDSIFDNSFFGFSETVSKTLRTNPVTVRVQPLPASGKPAGFKSLVGSFKLTSSLSASKVEKGDSVTLTLNISGPGNLKNNQNIEVSGLQNFKVYDDKPAFESKIIDGKSGGSLVIKKALVPRVEGKLQIPQISVPYFNPASRRYEKAITGPYVLDVQPAKDTEKLELVEGVGNITAKQDVKILGKDILPIHTGLNSLTNAEKNVLSAISFLLFIVPIVIYLTAFMFKVKAGNKEEGAVLARRKNAYRVFEKNILLASKKLKDAGPSFYQLVQKALKDFMGDIFQVSGSALTAKEMHEMLISAGVSADTDDQINYIMIFCDSGQFGSKGYTLKEKENILDLMKKSVSLINKKLKK
jgi:hypothetical protein